MHKKPEPEPADLDQMKYEKRDLSPKGVIRFIGIILILGVWGFATISLTMGWFERTSKAPNTSASELAKDQNRTLPSPPVTSARLQDAAARPRSAGSMPSMLEERQAYEVQMNVDTTVPRWVNKEQNVVALPLDDALKIVAERGIAPKSMPVTPVAPAAAPAHATPVVPTQSESVTVTGTQP